MRWNDFRKILTVAATLRLVGAPLLHAQSAEHAGERFFLAVYGGYGVHRLTSDFAVNSSGDIIGSTSCGRFQEGTANAWLAGMSIGMVIGSGWRLALSPEVESVTGELRFPCVDPADIRLPDGSVTPVQTDFIADISHGLIAARLTAEYAPFSFPLRLAAGPVVALSLSSEFNAREEIVSPVTAEFVSGGQQRRMGGRSFKEHSISLGIDASISAQAMIGRRLYLVPSIRYRRYVSDQLSWSRLQSSEFAATLGIERVIGTSQALQIPVADIPALMSDPPRPIEVPAPLPEQPMTARLDVHAVDDLGELSDTLVVPMRRTVMTEFHPLLPFIFFEEGEDAIPERYIRRDSESAASFSVKALRRLDRLDVYHNLLDIIGSRLVSMPDATLTLTATEPDAVGDRSRDNRSGLAARRAATVRDYLVNVWNIAPDRITTVARQHPASPTNSVNAEGDAENRRVEISSNQLAVTDPLIFDDTIVTVSPPRLHFRPSFVGGQSGLQWDVTAELGGQTFAIGSGDSLTSPILWRPDDRALSAREAVIRCTLTARRDLTVEQKATAVIPVRYITTDSNAHGREYYSLILFDFADAKLRPEHQRTVEMINRRIDPEATVAVAGYADRLGETDRNIQLSRQRAQAVAELLNGTVVDSRGRGEATQIYDNSLPEGRFYSRSVVIETSR